MEVGVIPATYSRSSHTGGLNGCPSCPVLRLEFASMGFRVGLVVAIDRNSFIAQGKGMVARIVRHAPRFQQVQSPGPLSAIRQVAQHQPGIHE